MYAINYDGDWVRTNLFMDNHMDEIFCDDINHAALYFDKDGVNYDIGEFVKRGLNPDAFEIVKVKIVRDDNE